MAKVQIVAHDSLRDELLDFLQDRGVIHITDLRSKVEGEDEGSEGESRADPRRAERIRRLTETLSRLQFAIDYLAPFEPKKGGFLSSLAGGSKVVIPPDQYERITSPEGAEELLRVADRCHQLSSEISRLEGRLSRIRADREGLQVWRNLDAPIELLEDTERTVIRVGSVPAQTFQEMISELSGALPFHHVELINTSGAESYVIVAFLKEAEGEVSPILAKYGFSPASFPRESGRIPDILAELDREEEEVNRRIEEIRAELAGMAGVRPKLMALYDHLHNELQKLRVQELFLETERAFILEGWVKERDLERFREELTSKFSEVDVFAFEPSPEDEPPVAIENMKLVEPFQVVTNLYGLPKYREVDPTPLIAPFFAFFLGLCLTDAGYGITLILLSMLGIKLFGRGRGARQLMGVLALSGVMAVVAGLLMGGFFGMKPPSPFNRLMIIDPSTPEGQTKFLYASWAIGLLQVWVGFLIKLVLSLKGRNFKSAFRADLPWVIMIPAMVMLLPSTLRRIGLTLLLICSAWLIALSDTESKSIAARIGNGFFNWYGISGVFGDILSYSRLFALGLATGIIAQVVNTMAKMVSGIPGIGPVAMVGMLIGGHLFNIGINTLGGFIHTARLQFVEYFTKFFEGGGEPFRPFSKERRYTVVLRLEELTA